ncbi:MAG TPA: amidohydrolase family protein, partial [Gemmataceae bacterium]
MHASLAAGAFAGLVFFASSLAAADADLIVHHAKVIAVDAKFSVAEALAVKDGKIAAVGTVAEIMKLKGPGTKLLDAGGKTVLPGLYDSHSHPVGAASAAAAKKPFPDLHSIAEVQEYIKKKAAETPAGQWIVLQYVFPTRLKEARFPTKEELDAAAPKHPVLYHAGPAGITNSMGLKVSGITKETKSPKAGMVVKDPKSGEPTGMLRNAYGLLKGLPGSSEGLTAAERRAAVVKLFHLYNERGLTSIGDRNCGRGDLDLYLGLEKAGELTVRLTVARSFSSSGTRDEIARRFEQLPGKDGRGGPTGIGTEWVRVGPIKLFLDGGMLNGSAYMREPWPKGPTYAVTEDDYRGLLYIQPEQLKIIVEEAGKHKWQVTAHTAGEGGMDVLLDAYEFVDRIAPIRDLRHCITHANFPSRNNLERCK